MPTKTRSANEHDLPLVGTPIQQLAPTADFIQNETGTAILSTSIANSSISMDTDHTRSTHSFAGAGIDDDDDDIEEGDDDDDDDEDEDDEPVHDQLPSVEEIRNAAAISLARAESASKSQRKLLRKQRREEQRRGGPLGGAVATGRATSLSPKRTSSLIKISMNINNSPVVSSGIYSSGRRLTRPPPQPQQQTPPAPPLQQQPQRAANNNAPRSDNLHDVHLYAESGAAGNIFQRRSNGEGGGGRIFDIGNLCMPRFKSSQDGRSFRWLFTIVILVCILFVVGLALGFLLSPASPLRRNSSSNNNVNRSPRVDQVMEWLVEQGISSRNSLFFNTTLVSTVSPQFLAAQWIADQDALYVPLPPARTVSLQTKSPSTDSTYTTFVERYVLAVLFFATRGSGWRFRWNFLEGISACEWNQDVESTDGREFRLGVTCNDANNPDLPSVVTSLHLPQTRLRGRLPTELGLLTGLEFLALNHNEVSGTVPSELSRLRKLTYFALHWNNLAGSLPSWISQLTNLRVLGLGNNQFVGTIPSLFTRLSNLLTIGIDDNLLSGTLEPLQDLTNLQRIYAEDNSFEQEIDTIFLFNHLDLEELDLSDNAFKGSIPGYYFALPKLEILDLHGNDISQMPHEFSPATTTSSLRFLALHNNDIRGPLPELSADSGFSALTHIDLSDNEFTGFIPAGDYNSLVNLRYLFLASNQGLALGPIPNLSALSNLKDLSLKATNRDGLIPEYLGQALTSLVLLDLDQNQLLGTIPTSLGQLSQLAFLLLNRNPQLGGSVPEVIQRLPLLQIFMIDRTAVTGDLNVICKERERVPEIVGADCNKTSTIPRRVKCPCCQICCLADDGTTTTTTTTEDDDDSVKATANAQEDTCKDRVYLGQLDPIWENSFERNFYQFAPQIIFG